MSYANRIVALVSGIVLLVACVSISGYPHSYLSSIYGSREYSVDVLTAIDKSASALVPFVLSMAWSWVTLRWLARPPRVAVGLCLAGMIVGFLCWEVVSAVHKYYPCASVECDSHLIYLYDITVSGWWWLPRRELLQRWPELLAFISGLAAAAAMLMKSKRITARAPPA